MKKVLVINPEVAPIVRAKLASKLDDGCSITYVEDLIGGPDSETLVKEYIRESDFLILIVGVGINSEPYDWVVKEATRIGKDIIVIYIGKEKCDVPAGVGAYAGSTINIESPRLQIVMQGGSVFETPDMQPAPSKTVPRGEC